MYAIARSCLSVVLRILAINLAGIYGDISDPRARMPEHEWIDLAVRMPENEWRMPCQAISNGFYMVDSFN